VNYNQTDLFLHATAPHNGTGTSRDAAESIKPQVNRLCSMVLKAIKEMPGGLTCQEVEDILGFGSGTATARINELANCQPPLITKGMDPDGKIIRRPNRSGRTAYVWFSAEAAK
jgi:RecA/RadA recombinase